MAFPAKLPKDILGRILAGGAAKAAEAGVVVAGGHSIDDDEPKYGMAVTGVIKPGKQVTNAAAKPGDVLILTKPLGLGIITTAAKQGTCPSSVLDEAVQVMLRLNKEASEVMMALGVNACTDITGFGLLGHLHEVAHASGVDAQVDYNALPFIEGVHALAELGAVPGGTRRNMEALEDLAVLAEGLPDIAPALLFDPQTSGGLLMTTPPAKTPALMKALRAAGVSDAVAIGRMASKGEGRIHVLHAGPAKVKA